MASHLPEDPNFPCIRVELPINWATNTKMYPPLVVHCKDHLNKFKTSGLSNVYVHATICDVWTDVISQGVLQGDTQRELFRPDLTKNDFYAVFTDLSITIPGEYRIHVELAIDDELCNSYNYTRVITIVPDYVIPSMHVFRKLKMMVSIFGSINPANTI